MLQYINVSNQHVVCLELMQCYVNYTSIGKKTDKIHNVIC